MPPKRHLALAASLALISPLSAQNTLYWDTNGTTAGATDDGSGNASGTWDVNTTSNWTFGSDGTDFIRPWTLNYDNAVFSAGSNATGTSAITVVGTPNVNSMTFEEGTVNLSGGSLNFDRATTIEVISGASATINSAITTGSQIYLTKTGGGNLTITSFNSSNVFNEIISNGGTLTYSGVGVATTQMRHFYAGQTASGNVAITAGASVATSPDGSTQIGANAGVTGILTVDGGGSNFQNTNSALDVGFNGTGTLNVTDGATVSSSSLTRFGVNATGEGHGLISGSGSTLTSQGALQLGVHGTGELTIASGGTVVANGGLVFSSASGGSGTLNLNTGGTLEAGSISVGAGGSGTLNLAGGTIKATGSFLTNGVDMSLTNASTVDTNGRNANFTGILSGSGSLTKTGASILVLSGENTYTGGTTISAGSLQIGNGGTTGSVAGNITNNAHLQFSRSNDITHPGIISGTGTLSKTGAANLTLSGANTFSGDTTVTSGTLTLGHENALQNSTLTTAGSLSFGTLTNATLGGLSGSDDLSLTNTTPAAVALTVGNNDASTTFSGILSGTGSLTKTGAGTLTLTGANTYTGGTTVSTGTLSGDATSLQGNITNNAAVVFDQTSTGTYSGAMDGTGSLTKTSGGNLTLSGSNSYSGGTTVSAGTLTVSSDANLGATSGALAVSNGATFNAGTNFQTNRAVTLDGSGTNLTTSNGELVIGSAGTGSLALTNNASASAFNVTLGFNSGTGTVDLGSGGTLTANNTTSLSGSSTLNLNDGGVLSTAGLSGSGTFNLAGGTLQANGALSSSLPAALTNASTVDTNGHATALSGNLTGTGSLTKTGAGTLTLSGSNAYSGATNINAGAISIATATNLGTGDIALTNGGDLAVSTSFEATHDRAITIDGAGSTLSSSNHLWLNRAGGTTNSITITNGGSLTTGTTLSLADVGSSSVGTLSVSGTNSAAESTGNLYVGYAGQGTATVASGGTISTDAQLSLGTTGGSQGTFNLNTGGTLQVGGTNGIAIGAGTGSFNANGGTLQVTGSDLTTSAPATLGASTDSTINTNGLAASLSGNIAGTGSLTKSGAGTLTLSGSNSYTGSTHINAGGITIATAANLGTGDIALTNGGDLAVSTSFEATTNRAITIDGAGSTLSSNGHLWLNRAGGTTNSIAITNGGALTVGTTLSLADVGSSSIGTLSVSGTDSSAASTGNLYVGYAGQGTATVASGGTLSTDAQLSLGTTAGSQGTFNLNDGGTLQVGGTNGITIGAGTGAFNANGGTIEITDSALTTSTPITLGTGTSTTIDTNSLNASLTGTLSGSGALTKISPGTLTLSAANTYTGTTTINAGTLHLANSSGSATGTGDVTLATGATLTGTGTIGGNLNLAAGATFAPGNSAGLVTIDGDFTLNSASIINLEIGGLTRGTQYDAFDVGGTLNLGGTLNVTLIDDYAPTGTTTYNLFDAASVGGTFSAVNLPTVINGSWNTSNLATTGELSLTVSAVPEPGSFTLVAALLSLGFATTRRRRSS